MGQTTYTHTFECNPGSIGTIETVPVKVHPTQYNNHVDNEIRLKILIPKPGVKFSVSGTVKTYTPPDSILYPQEPEVVDLMDVYIPQPLFPNDYRNQQLLGYTADPAEYGYAALDAFSGGLILGCEYETSSETTDDHMFLESETFITLSPADTGFHLEIVNEDTAESNPKKLYYDWECARTIGDYKDTDDTSWKRVIYYKTSKEHIYTNLIGFYGDYYFDNSVKSVVNDIPRSMQIQFQFPEDDRYQDNLMTKGLSYIDITHTATEDKEVWSQFLRTNEFFRLYKYTLGPNGCSGDMLLYCDCALAVFSVAADWQRPTENIDEYKEKWGLTETTILWKSPVVNNAWGTLSVPWASLMHVGNSPNNKRFYSSYEQWNWVKQKIASWGDNEAYRDKIATINQKFVSPDDERQITKRDRWIQNYYRSYGGRFTPQKISAACDKVVCIKVGDADPIEDHVTAWSPYARYTGYWQVLDNSYSESLADNKKKTYCAHYTDPIVGGQDTELVNRTFIPIFKPFAEADLVVFDKDNRSTRDVNFLLKKLSEKYQGMILDLNDPEFKDKYNSQYDTDIYRKQWYIDTSESEEKNSAILRQYCNTVAPFRTEIWDCKSGRKEYDVNSNDDPNNGHSFLTYANSGDINNKKFITKKEWKSWHDMCQRWNPNGINFVVYMDCGFGPGIKEVEGGHRTRNNYNLDQGQLISKLEGYDGDFGQFCIFGSSASYFMYGDKNISVPGMMLQLDGGNNSSYKDLCKKFNDRQSNSRGKAIVAINEFLTAWNDIIYGALKIQKKQTWLKEQSEIKNDLENNQGRKYFDVYNWTVRNLTASDTYVDNTSPKTKIHDGFVGLIKKFICGDPPVKSFFWQSDEAQKTGIKQINDYMGNEFFEDNWKYTMYFYLFRLRQAILSGIKIPAQHKLGNNNKDTSWHAINSIFATPHITSSGSMQNSDKPFMSDPLEDAHENLVNDNDLYNIYAQQQGWVEVD